MDNSSRAHAYRAMWLFVSFDLPTETKLNRKAASKFRKDLLDDGFTMFQFSVYIRHCASRENAQVHKDRIKRLMPSEGKVSVLQITDKQFEKMENFYGRKEEANPSPGSQMELF